MSCKYCEAKKGGEVTPIANGEIEFSEFQYELYVSPNAPILVLVDDNDLCRFSDAIAINYCPMCGRSLRATHNTHSVPPSDSKTEKV